MHGTPITVTADKEGITPEEVASRNHASILETIERMHISYDRYTNTHTENHFEVVHEIFLRLLEKGLIEKKTEKAPYCPKCAKFMPDRYIEGKCPDCGSESARGDQCDNCGHVLDPTDLIDPHCKICGSPPELRETEHFYLLLSKMEESIEVFVKKRGRVWRPNVRKTTNRFFEKGLRDRAVTRDLRWGVDIPLEGYEDKRIYVWFEAVCGYLSASKEYSYDMKDPNFWKRFWEDEECRHYYFLAKDNIPFHTIIWPAILIGYGGLNLPYDVPANEFLQWDGSQFSKSRGHGAKVNDFLMDYPADPLRFYLSTNMPENKDTNFDLNEFIQKNNTELLGALGNYLHRVVTFISSNFGCVPPRGELGSKEREVLDQARIRYESAMAALEKVHLKEGIFEMMSLTNEANRYFNDRAPWKLINENRVECGSVLSVALQLCRIIAYGMYPYIPDSMNRWCRDLDIPTPEKGGWMAALDPLEEGKPVKRTNPLFKKLELVEETEADDMADKEVKEEKSEPELITFEQFMKSDLRVGKVLKVKEHPDADRLYVLDVDLGEDQPRQLVAGLKDYYDIEDIEGKSIVVVSNMKPARMRGVESRGMLLAAESGEVVSLLTIDRDLEPGSPIH